VSGVSRSNVVSLLLFALVVILEDKVTLVDWDTEGFPQEFLISDDGRREELRQHDRSNFLAPDFLLLVQSSSGAQLLDVTVDTTDTEDPFNSAESDTGLTSLVQTTVGGGGEDVGAVEPELEGVGREVRRKLADKNLTELRVLSFGENLPDVIVGELSREGGDLELEHVVLGGVHVDGVNALRSSVNDVGEKVVTSGGDGKDDIFVGELQDTLVDAGVLPGKGVDVGVVELGVLLEELVVVDTVGGVLVEEGRKGQVDGKVKNSGLETLGAELTGGGLVDLPESLGTVLLVVDGGQVGGVGNGGVELCERVGVVESSLGTSNPNVVRNTAEDNVSLVNSKDGSKGVLQVIATTFFKVDAVKLKPNSPKLTREPVDMASEDTSRVVTGRVVGSRLNVKVGDGNNSSGR
jgi:hypothetical protein